MLRWASILMLVAASGCASSRQLAPPTSDLDRAIRYREVTSGGKIFDISTSSQNAAGVPDGIEVDINSRIEIEIRKDEVRLPDGLSEDVKSSYSQERGRKLREALEKLSVVIEARAKVLEAFKKTQDIPLSELVATQQYKDFLVVRRESARAGIDFKKLPLWEDGTFSVSSKEVDLAFRDQTYRSVGEILQKELNAAESSLRESEEQLRKRAVKLTMEAFLQPVKGDAVAIHLPRYDTLDQREAKFKDSFMLDREDWDAFQKQYRQTVELASTAEKVRVGEMSLSESLRKVGLARVEGLLSTAEQLEKLLKEDWKQITIDAEGELREFNRIALAIAQKHKVQALALLAEDLEKAQKTAKTSLPIDDLRALAEEFRSLRDAWKNTSPNSLPDVVQRTESFIKKSEGLFSLVSKTDISAFVLALSSATKMAEVRPTEMAAEAWGELSAEISAPGKLTQAKSLLATFRTLDRLRLEIATQMSFLDGAKPTATAIRKPHVTEVSWADAPNTRVDLSRAPRSIDDGVHVIARLKIGDAEPLTSQAVFSVQKFGRHSSLAPSVVLAKPMKAHSSSDRDFKFAPAVAWLHTYYPRQSEPGALNSILRFSQVGVGLHAAFLDHDSQKDTEIGVGGAISFWKDRIVAGVGWNLMNNSRSYVYVGSNLIPVLQALGYGKEGSAGKQP